MIQIDECKAVRADGYKVSQKGDDGPLTVTIAGSFRQKQAYTAGMAWMGGDELSEFYAENIEIDGLPHDIVLLARRRRDNQVSKEGC